MTRVVHLVAKPRDLAPAAEVESAHLRAQASSSSFAANAVCYVAYEAVGSVGLSSFGAMAVGSELFICAANAAENTFSAMASGLLDAMTMDGVQVTMGGVAVVASF